jgi:hypothetical protein
MYMIVCFCGMNFDRTITERSAAWLAGLDPTDRPRLQARSRKRHRAETAIPRAYSAGSAGVVTVWQGLTSGVGSGHACCRTGGTALRRNPSGMALPAAIANEAQLRRGRGIGGMATEVVGGGGSFVRKQQTRPLLFPDGKAAAVCVSKWEARHRLSLDDRRKATENARLEPISLLARRMQVAVHARHATLRRK